jgi:hypothetical protein
MWELVCCNVVVILIKSCAFVGSNCDNARNDECETVESKLQVVFMHTRLTVNGVLKDFLKKRLISDKLTCCIWNHRK